VVLAQKRACVGPARFGRAAANTAVAPFRPEFEVDAREAAGRGQNQEGRAEPHN
jgi:hypothetical protein